MTYKRKATQERVKKIQKAISLWWRQQDDDNEAEKAGVSSGYDVRSVLLPPAPTLPAQLTLAAQHLIGAAKQPFVATRDFSS